MNVTFKPMQAEDFAAFRQMTLESYADDLFREGQFPSREAAFQEALDELKELLPQGLATPNHHLFNIYNDQAERVGYLWYDLLGGSKAFIDDFFIASAYRRRGYAFKALSLLEAQLQERHIPHIALHVFDGNQPARLLYEKCGFSYLKVEKSQPGSLYMFKRIDG